MDRIIGNPVPVQVGKKVYLVSYISMGEWQTFMEFLRQDAIEALEFLVYCSLHRADPTIKEKAVGNLLRKYASSISFLIDTICGISFPKVNLGGMEKLVIGEKETKRNVKSTFRILSRMHGWTPQQISDMSPAQVYLYMMGGSTGTGIEKMNSLQYQAFLASRGVKN